MPDWRDAREAEYERSREEREQRREEKRAREQRRRRIACLVALGVACGLILIVALSLIKPRGISTAASAGSEVSQGGTGSASSADGASSGGVGDDDVSDEAQARIDAVMGRASANCTGAQPQGLTDPETYAERGRHLMQWIADTYAADPDFANGSSFTYQAHYATDGSVLPYLIAVNREQNVATVYTRDDDGYYTVPYQAFICSSSDETPMGYFQTPDKKAWGELFDGVYGQYVTTVSGDILFHSVPYYSQHKDDLEYQQYDRLGTAASLGCIRLQVCDVKWIYDNCPLGTPVVIYDDEVPGPMGKPGTIRTDEADDDPESETYRGFDPTDPDSANPWPEAFRSGTAIRSDQAQADWDQAQEEGAWDGSINPSDLLGRSTDASVAGNPG